LKDKKLRYEDALNSVDSAKEMGIIPGGGACLAYLQDTLGDRVREAITDEDEQQGAMILMRSLSAPCMQIGENAGIEGAVILSKVQQACRENGFGFGWNAATGEYGNLYDMGVIDPAKVAVNAIENAASIAGLVLTTECVVTEIPKMMTEAEEQALYDQQGLTGLPPQ